AHLAPFLQSAAPAAALQLRMQVGRELHRDGARAAQAGEREPVDAAVPAEAPVLGGEHLLHQHGRHVGERDPVPAASRLVDADARQRLAVAVEQPGVRGAPLRPRVRAGDHAVRGDEERSAERGGARRRGRREEERGPPHGPTSTSTFGISPNISGEYIASTRVAGRSNRPGLLRRTVYSTENFPFGTNSKYARYAS